MRKVLLALLFVATAAQAGSYTYPYLALRTSDGTTTALSADNLEITFGNGKLYATNSSGTTTLDLTTLSSMYFTDSAGLVGDINNDGKLTIGDVTELIDIYLGTTSSDKLYDVDGDGKITERDIVKLVDLILQKL